MDHRGSAIIANFPKPIKSLLLGSLVDPGSLFRLTPPLRINPASIVGIVPPQPCVGGPFVARVSFVFDALSLVLP